MIFDSAYGRGDYDYLYKNYLGSGHDRLARAVQEEGRTNPTSQAIDLCAGTGAMTEVLVRLRIPQVIAVDKSAAMLDKVRHKIQPYEYLFSQVSCWTLDLDKPGAFDAIRRALPEGKVGLITCRQGIGYLRRSTLLRIPRLLTPGGVFMCNSFIEPSNLRPWWHRHKGGIHEAGVYVGKRVFHFQFRWPRFDFTHFKWHDLEGDIAPEWLKEGFAVAISRHKHTLIATVRRIQ